MNKTNISKELEDICRMMSLNIHKSENANKKAHLWICGDILISTGKKTKCSECGCVCYYDTKLKNIFVKNHKKICLKCAFKNHLDDMSALEQSIIKQRAKIEGWIK